MRLQNLNSDSECAELKLLSEWISSIRDGTISGPNDGHATIKIPNDLLITGYDNPVDAIVISTFPTLSNDVCNTLYLQRRVILAPILDVVESMNEYMISLTSTEVNTYLSSDSTYRSDSNVDLLQDIHTPTFLNGIRCFGVPNLELKLKVGTPMMLLRNIDHSVGLCNGTRLVITKLSKHVLEAKILARHNARHKVLIPIMTLTPSDPRLPFKFTRRQYPIIISYAMTINKSQRQSLSHVGLYLKKPVFSHGQLYIAVSRVTTRDDLRILIYDKDERPFNSTMNVMYKEVFQNL